MTRRQLQRLAQIATLVVLGLILYLTLTPSPPGTGPLPPRWGHFIMFAVLGAALALWYATAEMSRRSPGRTLMMVVLAIWVLAGVTEFGQELVQSRHPSINDWFANMAGGITGLLGGSFAARLLLERDER